MDRQSDRVVTLTRDELYERVWEEPMVSLAKEFGLSDRGLAKICERFRIPRPPRGYWAKRRWGKSVRRPRLRPLKEGREVLIRVRRQPRPVTPQTTAAKPIVVPEVLTEPHPLIVRTEKSLRSARPDDTGLVLPRAKRALRVRVSPENIDRAMRVMDAVAKALEENGSTVETTKSRDGQPSTVAVVDGERIEFRLTEKLERIEREPTRAEKRLTWLADKVWYRYCPTGLLSLEILTLGDRGARRTWSDTRRSRLESRLGTFVAALGLVSDAIQRRRREWEEESKRRAAFERRRAEKLRLIREGEERIRQLEVEVEAWHRSQRIRAYVAAVREAIGEETDLEPSQTEKGQWMTWATSHADRLDPLVASPPSILDEKRKWERWWV